MTPGDAAISLKEWVRDLFAQTHSREDQIDARLTKLEDRANRAEPRLLSRQEYETRHTELEKLADQRLQVHVSDADRRFEHIEERLSDIETWKANVTGRVVGMGFVGVLLTAGLTAFISHVLS